MIIHVDVAAVSVEWRGIRIIVRDLANSLVLGYSG